MYKIFSDDTLIYDSNLDDFAITKGQITKEINKSGSFVFTIQSSHPYYNRIQKMKTIITVTKGNEKIFRGRVINEVIGFYKDKTFTCEGELGFLLDSIIRPFTFTGTPEQLLGFLIDEHNAQVDETKRFEVGTVTVTDPNDYIARSNSAYETTSDNLQSRLLDLLGGYLFITEDDTGTRFINWYADSPYRSNQVIEFGENLLSFTKTNRAEDIATAIIPLGAEIGDEPAEGSEATESTEPKKRLTIAEINGGVDYVYNPDAVERYGWIYKVETWNDVTVASNLKAKAEAFLESKIKQSITIELSAIDLSLMDHDIDGFQLGDYIQIVSNPHNLDDEYLLEKQTIDLLKPDNDKITLGYSYSTFTDTSVSNNNQNTTLVKTVESINSSYANSVIINSEIEKLRTLIDVTSTGITSEILAEYVVNDELTSRIGTVFTQLKEMFELKFTDIETVVNENDIERRREYREITSYIRFVDGNIVIGEVGNEVTLKIENDRLAILEGETEVAYISNHKLYITDGEFLGSMRIGNFAFLPRANGNLSFKKVGG